MTIGLSERDGRIAVTDTGPGIPPEQPSSIFDRYARSADSGADAENGHGTTIRLLLPLDA